MAKLEEQKQEELKEAPSSQPLTMLPKPVRLFSYLFFGMVLVAGVAAWFWSK